MKRFLSKTAEMGIRLDPAQEERIIRFERLLRERAIPAGLVAASDADRLFERHLLDSLRPALLFSETDHLAYDLGSGAGLPGVPLAIALPRCRFTLAESKSKRSAFLELAVERLSLENVVVHAEGAESLSGRADVITARAFAPLARTWPLAARLLRVGGRLIYFAGEALRDPGRTARHVPGPPRRVRVERVLESSTPLVMMTLE